MSGGAYHAAHFPKPMSVQIEVDEMILPEIDLLAKSRQSSRYETVNEVLRKGLRRESIEEKVRKFKESHELIPQTRQETEEIAGWEEVQEWGDGW